MTAGPQAPAGGVRHGPAPVCLWCGAATRPVAPRLVACQRCGTASTYPSPDDAELLEAYSGWYRPPAGRFTGGGDRLLRRSRATLARRVDGRAPAGPVLDVGCGEGVLLDALHARGREAVGLEREAARQDVRACEPEAFDEREGDWAAAVFWHSLEHVRAPATAIDRASTLLRSGGLLIVAVPNWASWQARVFGERWLALDLPRHLVHLPAAALLDGLSARGMEIERVSYWRGGQVVFGWLHGLVGTIPGDPDLYDAIRRPGARRRPVSGTARVATLMTGMALTPVAVALAAAEVAARAGGSVYVEARRP